MYNDITEIFNRYLTDYPSPDIAESEFKKDIAEDNDLRSAYRDWCHEVGSSEKDGFFDYCDEYLQQQNDVWENLNDFDE